MVVCDINGGLGNLPLFCDHQDTEYELWEIEIGVSGPILTQKKTSKYIQENDIHTLQYGWKKLWYFFIFIEL